MSEQPEEQTAQSTAEGDDDTQRADEQEHTETTGDMAQAVGEADAYGEG